MCEASFFTFRITFCIMFVAITLILSIYIYGIFLYGSSDDQKINMPRNIRYLSAFLVDNRDLSSIHMFVYNYFYGTVPVRYRYRTLR